MFKWLKVSSLLLLACLVLTAHAARVLVQDNDDSAGLADVEDEGDSMSAATGQCQDIVAIVTSTPELSTLAQLVQTAGIVDALAGPDKELTLFAPNNQAFMDLQVKLGDEAYNALAQDPMALAQVLRDHVLNDDKDAEDIFDDITDDNEGEEGDEGELDGDDDVLMTLNDRPLTVVRPENMPPVDPATGKPVPEQQPGAQPTVPQAQPVPSTVPGIQAPYMGSIARVVVPDIEACEAEVHIIDTVLVAGEAPMTPPMMGTPAMQPALDGVQPAGL